MLQAAHTKLLNSNNFVVLGDTDKVYHTDPSGLIELIKRLNTDKNKNNAIDYICIANYCKSLILNANIVSFDLSIIDVLKIWEIRIICLFIVNIDRKLNHKITDHNVFGKDELINDKMIIFEATNMLNQLQILNTTKVNNYHLDTNKKSLPAVKLDNQLNLLLMWIKYNGQDIQLLEYLYREVFFSRFNKDVQYLQRLKYAVIGTLLKRKEFISLQSIVESESEESTIRKKLDLGETGFGVVMYCLGISIGKISKDREDIIELKVMYQLLEQTLSQGVCPD
jgi:hypothetical protein